MKLHSILLILTLATFSPFQIQAQSTKNSCANYLYDAARAGGKPQLEALLKKFEDSDCVKKQTEQQMVDGSANGLMYVLYRQSANLLKAEEKIAKLMEQNQQLSLNNQIPPGWRSAGSAGSSGASSSSTFRHFFSGGGDGGSSRGLILKTDQ